MENDPERGGGMAPKNIVGIGQKIRNTAVIGQKNSSDWPGKQKLERLARKVKKPLRLGRKAVFPVAALLLRTITVVTDTTRPS